MDRFTYNKQGEMLVIDGTAEDDTLQGDAENAPFFVFNVAQQQNVAGPFESMAAAEVSLSALSGT